MADNEVEDGEAGQGLNPIACSYCRQRKRKVSHLLHWVLQGGTTISLGPWVANNRCSVTANCVFSLSIDYFL